MEARRASAAEDASWDELVLRTGRPHLLQSRGWAELKAAFGWRPERYVIGSVGLAQVLVKEMRFGLSLAYAPRGPLVSDEHIVGAVAALRTVLAGERHAVLLCDPECSDSPALQASLRDAGARIAPVFVQPRRTLIVDLGQEPDALLAAMRRKHRQYVRKAERAGVITEDTDDLDRFLRVLRTVAERDRFSIHDVRYFAGLRAALADRCHLFMARVGSDDAGALLVVRMGDRAWELYGGWAGTHAEDRPFYLLKWRAMLRMRALGVRRYDMWGLADRPSVASAPEASATGAEGDPFTGIENFKLGFGGEVATWVGMIEMPMDRWLFPLWQAFGRSRLSRAT